MHYLYDGSFEGLLTCIFKHYYEQAATGIFLAQSYQKHLFYPSCLVVTNNIQAKRVYRAIQQKISATALEDIYYVFLSHAAEKEMSILNFVQLGFQQGATVYNLYTHPAVLPIRETVYKVQREAHRFFGLIRFTDHQQFLYACYEPDHNITELLMPHFADRLAQEKFIIHDIKRQVAGVYQNHHWYLTDNPQTPLTASDNEQKWQALWQTYFKQIGITSRNNPRLQKQFMPKRYWRHLTEMQSRTDSLSD